jgi:ABC-type bacteriocin/lantibiotic exporter with double-glycine peptidase domain
VKLSPSKKSLFSAVAVVYFASAAAAQASRWLDVPFVAQPENGCGAAVISMTIQYWNTHGANVSAESFDVANIQNQLYSPAERGIKASAMKDYFEKRGFKTFAFRGEWKDIEQHIAKGRPLIVALQESKSSRTLHYVVVAGTDANQKLVLLNDSSQRKLLKMPFPEFNPAWARTDYWTLLVVPKT